jgi:hypothetical protein
LTNVVYVSFGGHAAQSFTINSDSSITAVTPAAYDGTVDVTVQTLASGWSGTSPADRFTYADAAPTVTGVSPKTGSAAGGDTVTITGSGFMNASRVSFGGVSASFTVNNDGSITATTPARSADGTVDVTVTNNFGGTSATSALDIYNYTDTTPPTVSLHTPNAAFTLTGGTVVSWSGADEPGGTGLAYYQVRTERAPWTGKFGAWNYGAHLAPTVTSVKVALTIGYDYCFSVQATDRDGNHSAWTAPRCTATPLDDRALSATTSGWTRATSSLYYLGTYTATTRLGAALNRTGAVLDRVALVATRCATCGTVGVYVGTVLIAKVNLAYSSTVHKTIFVLPVFSVRSATITLKVLTSGETVQVDGLGVSRT